MAQVLHRTADDTPRRARRHLEQLLSAIGEGFDHAAFNGAAVGPHAGVLNTTGTIAINPETLIVAWTTS